MEMEISLGGYNQFKAEDKLCGAAACCKITVQPQTDYLDEYKGVQIKRNQVSQFDETSFVTTTYLRKVNMTTDDSFIVQEQFTLKDQSTAVGTL